MSYRQRPARGHDDVGDPARDRSTDDEVGRMPAGPTAAGDEDDAARWLPLRLP